MNKNETHGFVNQLLVYTLVMICFSGSIGLGTVWMRQQMAQTANSIRMAEARCEAIERHLAETNALIAGESSKSELERRNVEWNLGLIPPQEHQIRRVYESVEDRLARKRNTELFAREQPPTYQPAKLVLWGGAE